MSNSIFWPPRHGQQWSRSPEAGSAATGSAVAFAAAAEHPWPRSFYYPDGRYVGIVEWNETGPWSDITGPVVPRGGTAGTILKGGRILGEWGDPDRCDMTFSVAKSYLSILAGLAFDDGLIRDLDQPVGVSIDGPYFASAHNASVTWRHLLHQSSEWQGEIWGKSDQVDHNRQIGADADNSRKGHLRQLNKPGTFYEYNDVRVNVLAYCLLRLFRRPLPEVLRERIMDPIGASPDWQWNGYDNSWVEIDDRRMQSVSGGAHWGGGMLISAHDHARLGLLVARRGRWQDRQLLSTAWIEQMLTPSPTNGAYGFLWWLNRGGARYASAPEKSVFALGAGGNIIWVDAEHDLVAVMRWMEAGAVDGFLRRLIAAAGTI